MLVVGGLEEQRRDSSIAGHRNTSGMESLVENVRVMTFTSVEKER